jgi:hypothetical protein
MVRWVHRWYNPGGRLGPDQLCHSLAQLALNVVRYTPSGKPSSTRTRRKKTDPGVSVERPGS